MQSCRVADCQPDCAGEREHCVAEELQTLHALRKRDEFGGSCMCEGVVEVPGTRIKEALYTKSCTKLFLHSIGPGPTQGGSAPNNWRPILVQLSAAFISIILKMQLRIALTKCAAPTCPQEEGSEESLDSWERQQPPMRGKAQEHDARFRQQRDHAFAGMWGSGLGMTGGGAGAREML